MVYSANLRPRCQSISSCSLKLKQHWQQQSLKNSNALVTSLVGLCIFLFIFCVCTTTSLVLVGRNSIATTTTSARAGTNLRVTLNNHHHKIINDNTSANDITTAESHHIVKSTQDNGSQLVLIKSTNGVDDKDSTLSSIHKSEVKFVQKIVLTSSTLNNNNNKSSLTAVVGGSNKMLSKVFENLTWRLPREIRPLYYKLLIHPDLKALTFRGTVSVKLDVSNTIPYIAIHSNKLSISHPQLFKLNNSNGTRDNVIITEAFDYPKFEYFLMATEEPLVKGQYLLSLDFNGSLTDRIVGFYGSSYFDKSSNETRFMATSKFEPTYARQAYPCFDEPAMKAKFKVSIVRPNLPGYIALSNVEEESSVVNDDNTVTVHFGESVPMSTYLSCFIVSDFEYKDANIVAAVGDNFLMRVFATRAQLDKVDFALTTGKGITEFYIDYFQIPYPLSKLDMAAIPDFVSGAMEHWGLVTFRETSLLYDPTISSTANKQRVATVVSHELSHMWFGNLVTMAWWNELWLNEGFASYIEYKGVMAVEPSWNMMEQFLIDDLHPVLTLDATTASHPIVQTAESPDQITELFDTITYNKGAAIIRMLEDFIGENIFRASVTNYLNANIYGNAVTDDLLTEIDALVLEDIDVKYIMGTWTQQMGYPVVTVTRMTDNQYMLTQKRFMSNPADEAQQNNDSEFNYRWYIPLTYYTNTDGSLRRQWFRNDELQVTISVPENHNWLKINRDQIGYYRVNYPVDMWQAFTSALVADISVLSASDRAHLLNDAFSLAEATQIDYSIPLELTRYLNQETSYVPWSVAASKLASIKNLLYYTDVYSEYRQYGQQLISDVVGSVGWEVTEDHLENLLRTTVLDLACSFGVQMCLDEAGRRFDVWIENPINRPNPDLRNIIYYYGMASVGNEERWYKMWELFLAEEDANEKLKLMRGLAGVEIPWLLRRFVDLAWDPSNVRGQDYFTCLQYIAANRVGESIVWDYVRENWEQLVDRFTLNERYLGRMIPSITSRFSTGLKLQEMQEFFIKYPEAGAGASARLQGLATVSGNIQWLENNKEYIKTWLSSN